jgi:hypothetical protein
MENFFIDEQFYTDIPALIADLEDVESLPDDWSCTVELAELEPIFNIDIDRLCQWLADENEERLTDNEGEEDAVLEALRACIDFDKLAELLPRYYYPAEKFAKITKKDLLGYEKTRPV